MINTAHKKLQNHPTLLQTQDLHDLCKPLSFLGVTTFAHLKISPEHQLSVLCNHPTSLINYVHKKYYEADPCVNIKPETTDIGQYLVWDAVQCQGQTADMLADSTSLDYRHVFTIIKKDADISHFYHFGTHLLNPSIHLMYINNLDLLDRFITYFNVQVKQSKKLLTAYDIVLNSDQRTSCVTVDNKQPLVTNLQDKRKLFLRSMLMEDPPNLTVKEIECAKLLAKGKTAKEIAIQVGLSYRTIEDRINTLKYKLKAQNKSDLIAKLLDIMLLYRI